MSRDRRQEPCLAQMIPVMDLQPFVSAAVYINNAAFNVSSHESCR